MVLTGWTKTNFTYSNNRPSVKFGSYRNSVRIIFRLPNGDRDFYYPTPEELKDKVFLLNKVNEALLQGYIPTKSLKKLYTQKKELNTTWARAIELYYTAFNTGKRQKNNKVIKAERTILEKLKPYFQNKAQFVEDLKTIHLIEFNKEIETQKTYRGKPYSQATIITYKRIVKSFINALIEYGLIDKANCDTTKIFAGVYRRGTKDESPTARRVFIPKEIIDSLRDVKVRPKIKEAIILASETGLRKTELQTLSLDNLVPNPDHFNAIKIFEKPEIDFIPKSVRSIRTIPVELLSQDSIETLKNAVKEAKKKKNKGKYPFLFNLPKDLRKAFTSIISEAIKLSGIKANPTDYTLHDLRRSLNLSLRDRGLTAEESAYILGHTVEVNEQSYYSLREKNNRLFNSIVLKAEVRP